MPLQAIVEDDQGRVVGPARDMQALPSSRESPGTSVYSSSIPLTDLRPGAYVLRVGTRASAGATAVQPGSWRFVCGPRRNRSRATRRPMRSWRLPPGR